MKRGMVVFCLFTMAYFLSYFFRSANAVITPDLSSEFGLVAAQLGLMTSLFFATFAAMQLPIGIWQDRGGPRWVTPGLMLVGAVGSAVFGLASSYGLLALGRALIGVGMAGVLMGSFKAFSQWFPEKHYTTVSGLLVGIGALGSLAAATPLAWLNGLVGWRTVFGAAAVATALMAAAIMIWTRNTPPGVVWTGGSGGDGSLGTVFRDKRFWHIAPIAFFLSGTLMGFQGLWAGPYLFHVLALDAIAAGNVLLGMGIGLTIGFVVSGWLVDRFGMEPVAVALCAIFALCQFALAAQPSLMWVRLIYIVFGFTGAINVMFASYARKMFPLNITGKAVSAVNLFSIGGTFLLQWWMGLIIGAFGQDAAGHYPPAAYTAALLFTGIGTVLALLWYLPLLSAALKQHHPAPLTPASSAR